MESAGIVKGRIRAAAHSYSEAAAAEYAVTLPMNSATFQAARARTNKAWDELNKAIDAIDNLVLDSRKGSQIGNGNTQINSFK